MTGFARLVQLLVDADVEFILIGGVAALAHGAARTTLDVDVVYRRTPENLQRIVDAFRDQSPYPRGAPRGLPFQWDARTLQNGLNFTLETREGNIDLLGEIAGAASYEELLPETEWTELFGRQLRLIRLDELIRVKRAAGRPKDFEAIAELELLRDLQRDRTK